jgi:sugar lactone lactonase YvrE
MVDIRQATPLSVPDSDELRFLPEGPYPLGESLISWVGIQHGLNSTVGSLNRYDLVNGENESFELPGRPGFAFPCSRGNRFVVGCERSLGIFDVSGKTWTPFCDGIDSDVDNTIINDGLAYEDNLIFGTKDLEFATKKAGLYLWRGRDQQLIRMRDDQICSNGKAIRNSANGLELIDIDSPTRQVVVYPLDIDAGALGEATVLLDLTSDSAVPDGAILTPDGSGLIVAMFNPNIADHGETRLYDIGSGQLLTTWQAPGSPQNTCPALVRHEGSLKLIITTAVEHMTDDARQQCPNAGQLFIADTDIVDDGSELGPVFVS